MWLGMTIHAPSASAGNVAHMRTFYGCFLAVFSARVLAFIRV
jgi:hypothetical protein